MAGIFNFLSQKLWDMCAFWIRLNLKQSDSITVCAPLYIIGTALVYKPQIFGPKIEEFPNSVHKLSVTLTCLQYKLQRKIGLKNSSHGL